MSFKRMVLLFMLLLSSALQAIKAITDQPVKYVVLENGQGHATLIPLTA